MSEVQRRQDQH